MEDLAFLEDQRTTRQQHMGQRDVKLDKKVENQKIQKLAKSDQTTKEKNRCVAGLVDEKKQRAEAIEKENISPASGAADDPDYADGSSKKKQKRSDKVTVELPKAPFDDPFICATLDRFKVTSTTAVGVFGALMKTGTTEGEQTDLNNFVVSKRTLDRTRNLNRHLAADISATHFHWV